MQCHILAHDHPSRAVESLQIQTFLSLEEREEWWQLKQKQNLASHPNKLCGRQLIERSRIKKCKTKFCKVLKVCLASLLKYNYIWVGEVQVCSAVQHLSENSCKWTINNFTQFYIHCTIRTYCSWNIYHVTWIPQPTPCFVSLGWRR